MSLGAGRGAGGRPRVGFLGVGWIGQSRLKAIAADGAVEVAAVSDPSEEMTAAALAAAPGARVCGGLDALLAADLDGLVIATPSALHADQTILALEAGAAVFCQKPLGRTADEVRRAVAAARQADRLLAVDLSYRFTTGVLAMRRCLQAGEIGSVQVADLVFHNAYGPDKPWFYDRTLSGGGCVMDLGVHLVDLALWLLDFPEVEAVSSALFADGRRLGERPEAVEDLALATLELAGGAVVRLACSWRLHAGQEAVIGARLHGRDGGLSFENVEGSFYDFRADRLRSTGRELLAAPPDDWSGRAAVHWARRLAEGVRFDPEAERLIDSAAVLDRIYGR